MGTEIYDDLDELPAAPRIDIPAADLVLLERAARAIGAVRIEVVDGEGYVNLHFANGSVVHSWNPLAFSGDALELAVKLNIHVLRFQTMATAHPLVASWGCDERDDGDPLGATRRAITRAASQIGK
jgi:hypothetical protein